MSIETSIEKMLSEIRNYNGNFGDPIVDLVNFNPIELLMKGNGSCQVGAGIGLLVNFSSHIDNATYEDALKGQAALSLKVAIDKEYCKKHTSLVKAFNAALKSESEFRSSLQNVYKDYVCKNA